MVNETLNPSDVIETMIELHIQHNTIKQAIADLKPEFFEACKAQDTDQIRHERVLIHKRISPGQWNYPSEIMTLADELKARRKDFQKHHEPVSGREEHWAIRLVDSD